MRAPYTHCGGGLSVGSADASIMGPGWWRSVISAVGGVRLGGSTGDLGISGIPQAPSGPVWVWHLGGPGVCPFSVPSWGLASAHCGLLLSPPQGRKFNLRAAEQDGLKERRKRTIFTLRKLLSLGPSRPYEELVQFVQKEL